MLQLCRLHTGGFVLHKLEINNQSYSVWYDKNGIPIDAERIKNLKSISVSKRCTNLYTEFEKIGKRYLTAN